MAGAITNESNAPAAALWFECVQLGAAGSVSQEIIMDIKKIGFIGLGVMGAPMAGHLLDAGFELKLYTRTKARAAELIARGATWCDTPADCAQDCDVVISIVGYPQDVREVWMGRHGAFNTMKPGSIGVDMTTSAPELAQELSTYYRNHNPFTLAQKQTVTIEIANVINVGEHTLQIDWVEHLHSADPLINRQEDQERKLRALLTYSIEDAAQQDTESILLNPLNIYIHTFIVTDVIA